MRQIQIYKIALGLLLTVLLVACGGSGGGGSGGTTGGTTGGAGGGASNLTTTTITPFKGMFIDGTVSLTDANGNSVPLLNNTGAINANGLASVSYATNVTYPLIVSVSGTYLNEVTGTAEVSTVPLRGLIPNSAAAAAGVPVTAITEIAVAKLLQQTPAGTGITPPSAVSAITQAASAVAGQFYSQAMSLPVFDAQGKTTSPTTLQLAALSVVANTRGTGADLTAKIQSVAQNLAAGKAVRSVIPQADYDSAINAVNGGAYSMLPASSVAQTIPAHTIPVMALDANQTPYNSYTAIAHSAYRSWASPTDQNNFFRIAFIKSDGSVWSWIGADLPPRQMPIGTGYSAIAQGSNHTVALKSDGSLWTWGYNASGQLGDGTTTNNYVPTQIGTGYTAVTAAIDSSFAVKSDGSLWAWGYNASGILGDGTLTNSLVPKMIGTGYAKIIAGPSGVLALKTDGSIWTWQESVSAVVPTQIGTGTGYVAIAMNDADIYGVSSAAIRADGGLWMWGDNTSGQLGDGTTTARTAPALIGTGYTAVSVGRWHTVALKSDGSLWAWGNNSFGQLGDGTTVSSLVPKQIGTGYYAIATDTTTTVAIKVDGTTWGWGNRTFSQVPKEIGTPAADALYGYSSHPITLQCGTGTPFQVTQITGPCSIADYEFSYAIHCDHANYSRAQINYYRCAMVNSSGTFKATYTDQYNWAVNNGTGGPVDGTACNYNGTQPGHYAFGICIPGAPVSMSTYTSTTGTGGTTLTAAQTAAAQACATAPYNNPPSVPYDPQADSNCQLAQFDACLHAATGLTTYDAEGRAACSVVSGLISATGSTWSCSYCPYRY